MSQFIGLQDIVEINVFTLSLKKWLQWTVKKTMLWKWIHDQFNFYWNDECSEAVKKTKKLRQIFINSQNEKTEKFISVWTITNKRSYVKQKFWNFTKQLIRMLQIKKICDVWSNESKPKIMFLMNCWKCSHWLKIRKKTLTKN